MSSEVGGDFLNVLAASGFQLEEELLLLLELALLLQDQLRLVLELAPGLVERVVIHGHIVVVLCINSGVLLDLRRHDATNSFGLISGVLRITSGA